MTWRYVRPRFLLQGGLWRASPRAPGLTPARPVLQLIGEEEDVSVYDIADHPDFRFRTTDIVIRIGNTEDGAPHKEDEVCLPHPPCGRFPLSAPGSICSPWGCRQVAPGDHACKRPLGSAPASVPSPEQSWPPPPGFACLSGPDFP